MKYQKKAVDLTDLAIGIIILGIVATIGASILTTTRDARLTDLQVVTTTNEKATSVADLTLSNTWGKSVINITNATGGELITSGNYTYSVDSVTGIMTVSNSTATFPLPWNITYDWYNTSRADWNLPHKASLGLLEYGNWFKIIVIVGIAAVILTIIFLSFGRGASRVEAVGGSY